MADIDKKIQDQAIVGNEADIGTAADVDEIMKKYDRESNVRIWEGVPKQIVRFVLAAFMVFMVYMNLWATWSGQIRRCLFVGMVVLFTFFVYPAKKGDVKPNHMPWYDILLAIVGCIPFFYYVANFKKIVAMGIAIGQTEVILGIIGILVLAECCRRAVGVPILCVASVFILYAFIGRGMSLQLVVYNVFYTTNGIIGTPISVCSTYIALFLMFGAFLEATGVANFFIDCANALVGWASGGPAKVAVVSSALCGMVSGSSVGNTVTTGSVTIPMMKKTGYPGEFAGAVEAASSTGGQIMPPIMGAAAFIMAEMTDFEYSEIIVRAILPAFLYFLGIFLGVHFKAKKLGLKGLPREELPKWGKLLPKIYLLVPLVLLVYMIIAGETMAKSAIYATIAAIAVSLINKDDRMTPTKFVNGLENGGKNCISIGVACAIAGIISVCITMTGLGGKLITYVVSLSNGHLIIALFLTMICCIVLGMGVPTTANYIIMASTCAPILINGMGMHVLAANMFVFYFGIVADITPPVALAAYAGSAIAKAPPMKTAWNATRLAIAAFIIPYIFAFNNAMIFVGDDVTVWSVASITISATLGMLSIASGLMGYLIHDLKWISRIALIAGGLLMIIPGTASDLAGFAVLAAIFVLQTIENKKEKKAASV
jgi:TRAP transporter 4TM/12TM fusion protein